MMSTNILDNGFTNSVTNVVYRPTGTFPTSGNFEVKIQGPLDTRTVVGSVNELTNPTTDGDNNKFQYYGILVIVSGADDNTTGDDYPESTTNDGIYRLKHNGNPLISPIDGKIHDVNNPGFWELDTTTGDPIISPNGAADSGWEKIGSGSNNNNNNNIEDIYVPSSNFTSNGGEFSIVDGAGGIEVPTPIGDLTGKTFSELFDLVFFPVQNPTFNGGNLGSIAGGPSGIYEVGTELDFTLTFTITRGSWTGNYVGVTQPQFYQGELNSAVATYTQPSAYGSSSQKHTTPITNTDTITPNFEVGNSGDDTTNASINSVTQNDYKVMEGLQSWTFNTSFAAAGASLTGKDSTNQPADIANNPAGAKNNTTRKVSFTGTYPVFINDWTAAGGETIKRATSMFKFVGGSEPTPQSTPNGLLPSGYDSISNSTPKTGRFVVKHGYNTSDSGSPNFKVFIPKLFGANPTASVSQVMQLNTTNNQFLPTADQLAGGNWSTSNINSPTPTNTSESVLIGDVEYIQLEADNLGGREASFFMIKMS